MTKAELRKQINEIRESLLPMQPCTPEYEAAMTEYRKLVDQLDQLAWQESRQRPNYFTQGGCW